MQYPCQPCIEVVNVGALGCVNLQNSSLPAGGLVSLLDPPVYAGTVQPLSLCENGRLRVDSVDTGGGATASNQVIEINVLNEINDKLVNGPQPITQSIATTIPSEATLGAQVPNVALLNGGIVSEANPTLSDETLGALSLTTQGSLRVDVGPAVSTSENQIQAQAILTSIDGKLTLGPQQITESLATTIPSESTTGSTAPDTAILNGALVEESDPTLIDGNLGPLSMTTSGRLRVDNGEMDILTSMDGKLTDLATATNQQNQQAMLTNINNSLADVSTETLQISQQSILTSIDGKLSLGVQSVADSVANSFTIGKRCQCNCTNHSLAVWRHGEWGGANECGRDTCSSLPHTEWVRESCPSGNNPIHILHR